jgi:transcriptional regulator with XRE-family HTH domain
VAVDIGTEGTIGGRIRAARESARLSLDVVAERAGVSPERLAGIESGESFVTMELDAIASALGLGVHGLLHESDVRDVLGRIGTAGPDQIDAAVGLLTQFVRDYEFLCALDE